MLAQQAKRIIFHNLKLHLPSHIYVFDICLLCTRLMDISCEDKIFVLISKMSMVQFSYEKMEYIYF
jgi:hypothetical protein